jgi:hypothetical protein
MTRGFQLNGLDGTRAGAELQRRGAKSQSIQPHGHVDNVTGDLPAVNPGTGAVWLGSFPDSSGAPIRRLIGSGEDPMPAALVQHCTDRRVAGADFPTVWHTVLRRHPLVAGPPIQMSDGTRTWLEIPLTTGHRLVHDTATGYRLLDLVSSVLRERVTP